MSAMESRVEALEVKAAFLEHTLAELDDLVRQTLDQLVEIRRELGTLRAEVKQGDAEAGEKHEPPPHHIRPTWAVD